jgi:dipeptidyl aminopeptidase/acylaminoacyl peptidase
MRPDGSERRWISEGLDRTFLTLAGCVARRGSTIGRSSSAAEDRGEQHLYRLDVDGSTPVSRSRPGRSASRATTPPAARSPRRSAGRPHERDPRRARRRARQLTSVSGEYLGWERFAAPCTDGSDEIDAWIMRPADFDPTKRYPVLLNVHGGPFTQYGEMFFDEAQMQAAPGSSC